MLRDHIEIGKEHVDRLTLPKVKRLMEIITFLQTHQHDVTIFDHADVHDQAAVNMYSKKIHFFHLTRDLHVVLGARR